MTPETLKIDRTFKVVGRIKKHTGTTVPAVRTQISKMLTHLEQNTRFDILRAIKFGQLSMLQVYDAYQRKDLDSLPTAATLKPLAATMRDWIDALEEQEDCSPHHATSLRTSLGYLEEAAPKAALHELPHLVEQLRDSLGREHPTSFNRLRSAALAFVRDTRRRSDPMWIQIAAIKVRKVVRPPPHALLTPERMRQLFPAPETDVVDAIAWSMVTTGMHQSEYWGRWETKSDRVHVEGTKRKARVRDIPLVRVPTVPAMHQRTWENKIRNRTKELTPRSFRQAYIQWLEEAGVPRTRRKMYIGHSAGDTTDLYERKEIAEFLKVDAAKLRTFLELGEGAAAQAVLRRA